MQGSIHESILNAARERYRQGESFRVRCERVRDDGKVCTPDDKDPALVVTRTSTGWLYFCHRCATQGTITDKALPPEATKAKIARLHSVPVHADSEKVTLPYDYLPMKAERESGSPIPWSEYHHLWKYSIIGETITLFEAGWSKAYSRVIIPLYEYAFLGDQLEKELVGWVGRDTQWKKDDNHPKWLTRAMQGRRRYFIAPGMSEPRRQVVVLVEDAISAMKVWQSTYYTSIALLNATVSDDLMRQLRGKEILLWLDADMKRESVKKVNRMRSLGLNAKHVSTSKDPKAYNSLYLMDTIRERRNHGCF